MKTAQEIFKELLKRSVAPSLRALGFAGSGQNYLLKSDHYWSLLAFQKSVYSGSTDLRFTINLYVVAKNEWDSERLSRRYFPEKPSATVHWGVGWNARIGNLLPIKKDYWWSLNESTDLQTLAEEVVVAITDCALPAMQARMKNEDPNRLTKR